MKFARGLLIFSYGLFSIAAQTLLFREFITTFESDDISVGLFFSSWFLWVGIGAILVYRAKSFAEKLVKNIELLFLSYLPAFILESILIMQARELAGIEPYALLSIRTILLLSMVVNAPVSIITGMLFPTACRWVRTVGNYTASGAQRGNDFAVSHIYIIEATGSFTAGLVVTFLLGAGISSARIFLVFAFIVSLSVLAVQLTRLSTSNTKATEQKNKPYGLRTAVLSSLILLSIFLCLVIGVDKSLTRYVRTIKWTKLLPRDALAGSFQTSQAEYLYGIYQDQWVVIREGSVCEALPDKSTAGKTAAISLCQNPGAERVLVIGSGLALCREFLHLPQIETITWTHCDNEYVREVNRFIPEKLKISDERFQPFSGDVRSLLVGKKGYYDIVILDLPDATSSAMNRYYTLEFYRQVKESLRAGGLLAVRTAGGENIMGTELINLGASTKFTLESVFSHLVLIPGDDTWFIVSDSEELTGEPATLRERFAKIEGGGEVFSPQALLSVYLPDRADVALKNYSSADLPKELLINRDSRPLTHLYSLLLAAKQSGAPLTKFVKLLALAGPLVFLIPILVFIVLRAAYITKTMEQGSESSTRSSSFDSSFLVFSAGCLGISTVIVLMYLYQTHFGSLYLHIGVISSLFMAGLAGGAVLISYLIKRISHLVSGFRIQDLLLLAVTAVHILILAGIAFGPVEQWTGTVKVNYSIWETRHLFFALAFVLCGLCCGCYFPIAARQLAESGFETGQAGSKLETFDHLGASIGGLLTSLALVPVLGTRVTIIVFAALLLANSPAAILKLYKARETFLPDTMTFGLRRAGYILFGTGLAIVLCSNLLFNASGRLSPPLPRHAAQALAGELNLVPVSTALADSGRKVNYFEVYETKEKPAGYIFSSAELAQEARGFGGKMNLAIYVDARGKLIDFHIIRSNETPAYLELLDKWYDGLRGRPLFQPQPFVDVEAVSGATVSSKAVLSALQISGDRFATQILGHPPQRPFEEEIHRAKYLPDASGIYLIGVFIIALVVTCFGGFWSRLAVLLVNLVVGGIVLNAQYSSEQMVSMLSGHIPATGFTGAFLLVTGVPLVVMLFGNIYCGYLCPFGAAQELLGYIVPERFKQAVPSEKMQKARFIKYVVLFVLIVVFFLSRNRTTLGADPLISIFNLRFSIYGFRSAMLLIAAAALAGAVFYGRFWCRYLCPAGAFLSLFNNVVLLKRYLPRKLFGKCEFGLSTKDQMDCLYCDRCRYSAPEHMGTRVQEHKARQVLLPYAFAVAILVAGVSIGRFMQVIPVGGDYSAEFVSAGGQARDIDLKKVQTMIEQKRLSDREAEFYKKVE